MNTLTAKPAARELRRGQALVLSALGMVLLVLMVCMTLSFGTRAKAKMEVQIVADQAAYSSAVAVARTYNMIALVNRVSQAHQVAMIGIQSAISFASTWGWIVTEMLLWYTLEIINQLRCCNWGCLFYGCLTAFIVFISRWIPTLMEYLKLLGKFPSADQKAAQEASNTAMANAALYLAMADTVSFHLYKALDNQQTTNRIKGKAQGGAPDWQVSSGGDKVAKREVGFIFGSPVALGVGAIDETNLIFSDRHAVVAAMAARGHFFTANRFTWFIPNGVKSMIDQALKRIRAQRDFSTPYLHDGNGYYGIFVHSDATLVTSSEYAWADDHGFGIMKYSGPTAVTALSLPVFTFSYVASNNSVGFHFGMPPFGMDSNHVLSNVICLLNCPSAWSNFVDYNPVLVLDKGDNFAQPKLPVTVYKDANLTAPDPYNLLFNFRFSNTGGGQTFDLKKSAGGGGLNIRDGAGTADISRQMGYGTGLTYYHRAGHWREPPNMFNPFWRAGITRPDVDRGAWIVDNSHDIEDTLRNSGAGWAASAYSALYGVGYQGISP